MDKIVVNQATIYEHPNVVESMKKQNVSQNEEENKNSITSKRKTISYNCKECGAQYKYKKILRKHEITTHSENSAFFCKICMLSFLSKEEQTAHTLLDHRQKKVKIFKCRICKNCMFNTKEEYLLHVLDLHKGRDNEFFICSKCGKSFKTKSELTQHNTSKCSTVRQFKCMVCGKELMTPGSLYNHMRRHSGQRCFMCVYCGKQFVTHGQLQVHLRIHTQDKAFKCEVCNKGFCHRQSLITHTTIHTGVKPYQCENCSKSFSCVGNLLKHRRTHSDTCGLVPLTSHRVINLNTRVKVKMNTPQSSKVKSNQKQREIEIKVMAYKKLLGFNQGNVCNNTRESILVPILGNGLDIIQEDNKIISSQNKENSETLQVAPIFHKNVVQMDLCKEDGPGDVKCCGKKVEYHTKEECKISQEHVHADVLTCKICNNIYSNWDSLDLHQNTFHRGLPRKNYTYICDRCGIQFCRKTTFEQHKQSDCGTNTFQCNICGKVFNSIQTLKMHLRVHNPKKFLCNFCGKKFRWKGQLNIHERSHTGEKPFKCLYCPKAFPYRESLVTHSSLHTGIRPHLCEACGSRFSCLSNLIKHRLTHQNTHMHTWSKKSQRNI